MAFKVGSYTVIPNQSAETHGSPLHSGTGGSNFGDAYWAYPGGPATTVASGWRYK